jgi:O-methyltransferase involved in polyketide biosynthesis
VLQRLAQPHPKLTLYLTSVLYQKSVAARAMEAEEETPLVLDPLASIMAGSKALKSARARQQPAPKDSGRKIKVNMMAIRTKWFDDQLEASLGMPVGKALQDAEDYLGSTASPGNAPRQCVVLGAGMDSRPWRLKLPASLRWFEIDREDVLQAKEDLLAVAGAEYEILSPMHRSTSVNTLLQDKIGRIDHHMVAVQYPLRTYSRQAVAADLSDASWKTALLNAGFDPSKPTVWLAEGLLMYLEPSRVDSLLKEIAGMSAPGSALLTVSVTDDVVTNIKTNGTASDLMSTWQFGCPADPKPWLAGLGWNAAVVATRASLAKALGLTPEICGFETDMKSPKNGRSLFIAASVA